MNSQHQVWNDEVLFKTVAGSFLYGTNTETSDIDVRGVCRMPAEVLVGLRSFEQYQPNEALGHHPFDRTKLLAVDLVIYGINKFAALALECNPNIVELLFAPIEGPTCYDVTEDWRAVVAVRNAFLSRRASKTFLGYATSQFKRMETHHNWMTREPPVKPAPEVFGGYQKPTGEYGWQDEQSHQDYREQLREYNQYQTWLANRNADRHNLEEQFGHDTKNSMHLCRLMIQGEELLQTGVITLPRPEAKWLLEVKGGSMNYEQTLAWFDDKKADLDKLTKSSMLPEEPNSHVVEDVVEDINMRSLLAAGRTKK